MKIEASKALQVGVTCVHNLQYDIFIEQNKYIVAVVLAFFEPLENYKYVVNRKRNDSFYLYCNQYCRHRQSAKLMCSDTCTVDNNRCTESKRVESCMGVISIGNPK